MPKRVKPNVPHQKIQTDIPLSLFKVLKRTPFYKQFTTDAACFRHIILDYLAQINIVCPVSQQKKFSLPGAKNVTEGGMDA